MHSHHQECQMMNAENGRTLIKKYNLYAEHEGGKLSEDDKLSLLNESVLIRPQVTGVVDPRSMRGADLTYAFDVAFQHDDPTVARDVAAQEDLQDGMDQVVILPCLLL